MGCEGNDVGEGVSLGLPAAPLGEADGEMEYEGDAQKLGEALTVTVAQLLLEPPQASLGVPVAREALPVPETRCVTEKVTDGEPDCEGDGEREPPTREALPVGEIELEVVPVGVFVSPEAEADRVTDTEPVTETEKLGLDEAQGVVVRVTLPLLGLGEGEGGSDAVPRADTLGDGVIDADRHSDGEVEDDRVVCTVADAQNVAEAEEVGVSGPLPVAVAVGKLEKVPVGSLVRDTTAVAETVLLIPAERLAEGHAEPVLLADAHGVTERVTVLQMLRLPARPKVAESVKLTVELCDADAREDSVRLTLLD